MSPQAGVVGHSSACPEGTAQRQMEQEVDEGFPSSCSFIHSAQRQGASPLRKAAKRMNPKEQGCKKTAEASSECRKMNPGAPEKWIYALRTCQGSTSGKGDLSGCLPLLFSSV